MHVADISLQENSTAEGGRPSLSLPPAIAHGLFKEGQGDSTSMSLHKPRWFLLNPSTHRNDLLPPRHMSHPRWPPTPNEGARIPCHDTPPSFALGLENSNQRIFILFKMRETKRGLRPSGKRAACEQNKRLGPRSGAYKTVGARLDDGDGGCYRAYREWGAQGIEAKGRTDQSMRTGQRWLELREKGKRKPEEWAIGS